MAIKSLFTAASIHKMMLAKIENMEKSIEFRLNTIGLNFVTDARLKAANIVNISTVKGEFIPKHIHGPRMQVNESSPSFIDRTGNLRSSIGYLLLKKGKEIKADFDQTDDGIEGYAKAKRYAEDLASQYQGSYVLVVVAGMEYAAAVESKGFDVLTGSSFKAKKSLQKHFKQI